MGLYAHACIAGYRNLVKKIRRPYPAVSVSANAHMTEITLNEDLANFVFHNPCNQRNVWFFLRGFI